MNPEAQEIFDRLVKLDPTALTDEDKEFLRARRSYLTSDQRRIFASLFKVEEVKK
jgi:hypothetical protein